MRNILPRFMICVGTVALASLAALGQTTPDGVVITNSGQNTIWVKPPQAFTPAVANPPTLVTIYSNLGKGKNVYNGLAGNGILGPNAGQLYQEWVGCSFRPKANHTVLEIQVGVTWVQGDNNVVLTLNADNHERPGKVLQRWQFSNLPTFGTCCKLQTAKSQLGIKVRRGVLYWVVLKTSPQHTNTYDVWNEDFNGQMGLWSNNIGSGWEPASIQQLNAFGVFGK